MKANNVRSIRVKDAIDFFVGWFQGMNQPKIREGINSIITLVEQDVEEKSYNAVKLLLQECREKIKNGEEADEVLFSSLARYNWILNGGQSDE